MPRRGDIYWIEPSPWRDGGEHTIKKVRPAIIVSNNNLNAQEWNFEIVYLTTQPKREEPTHCTITLRGQRSTVLCEQITTVSEEQLGDYMGSCDEEEMNAIDECLLISLGLDNLYDGSYTPRDKEEDDVTPSEYADLWEKYLVARAQAETIRRLYDDLLERHLATDV